MSLQPKEVDSIRHTQKIEYTGANPLYIGLARPGTLSSAKGWSIRKLTYSGDNVTDIQWAGADAGFVHIYDNRASLSYS